MRTIDCLIACSPTISTMDLHIRPVCLPSLAFRGYSTLCRLSSLVASSALFTTTLTFAFAAKCTSVSLPSWPFAFLFRGPRAYRSALPGSLPPDFPLPVPIVRLCVVFVCGRRQSAPLVLKFCILCYSPLESHPRLCGAGCGGGARSARTRHGTL